jgi:RNase P protein component
VNYIYQTKIVEANLDTNISKQEIEDYYNSHKDNFILNENIIKVNYFKIPIKAQGLDKIKKLLYANNPKEQETLRNLCVQNAENFFMNDSTWLLLDDIKKEIPKLKEQPDFNLVTGRILEFVDPQYYYYLRVKDIKNKNSISPINFERKNIKNFVINNRKTRLIREYKQLMLEKAKADKTFTTY